MALLKCVSEAVTLLCKKGCLIQQLPYRFQTIPNYVQEPFNPSYANPGYHEVSSSLKKNKLFFISTHPPSPQSKPCPSPSASQTNTPRCSVSPTTHPMRVSLLNRHCSTMSPLCTRQRENARP